MIPLSQIDEESLVPLTRAQYDLLIAHGAFDEDEHIELLEGALVQMSPQDVAHAIAIENLTEAFEGVRRAGGRLRVQLPFAASETSEPEPDLSVVPLHHPRNDHPSAALLIVEVARSSLRHDRKLKGRIYAEAGVPEYWVVNLKDEVIEVFTRPSATGYRRHEVHRRATTIKPSLLKGFKVRVSDILPAPKRR